MSIENEKLKLIEWIKELRDDSTIEKIKMLKDNPGETDWWNEITEEEKASIEKGLVDIKEGRITPHSDVKKRFS
ncbi:MAG: hypothetical protein A2057_07775 [Ignavibacteria bacterium GWA2_35_9]|nr:MAG: hypothetical protein A2057_07775 [Ignavibacteria bacterium GWA2_35_9]OGU43178.1 MAG: hypothetical protein A2000_14830 [Ignavibacteria bacterium GWB2_36_8]OGU50389.1 MAG: hypothetical protein A2080_05220 [Ignavibacteria bacterium GWC2_36_12]OGV08788.1 MAG: hypothetical protein A2330_05345 [Ignavibacteria bacterium RIFOXYB2_FULL_36_7]OGV10136.1 MAG: hypothetical protein A3J84_09040 [Ignavibacteria bacterium RIFOXYA2_FULL_37_17]